MQILPKDEQYRIVPLLDSVPFNTNFARSVVDDQVDGTIMVDDAEEPRNAYVLHPYGMSLLVGDAEDADFQSWLFPYMLDEKRQRARDEWMQIHSDAWSKIIHTRLSSRIVDTEGVAGEGVQDLIELHHRVNFDFNYEKYQVFKGSMKRTNVEIDRLDALSAGAARGTVVPMAFWKDPEEFVKKGFGFCVLENGEMASIAFTAFVHDEVREIGIETKEGCRGRGLAAMASAAFIDHCLQESFVPVWSCREGNRRSYDLAVRLGFEPSLRLPYYRLCRHRC